MDYLLLGPGLLKSLHHKRLDGRLPAFLVVVNHNVFHASGRRSLMQFRQDHDIENKRRRGFGGEV